jgi:hypothetical protein
MDFMAAGKTPETLRIYALKPLLARNLIYPGILDIQRIAAEKFRPPEELIVQGLADSHNCE